MSITIIVENGTVVENANSYVSVADLTSYATDNAYTLPSDAETVKRGLVAACEFLNGLDYIGSPATDFRDMAFPRIDVDGLEDTVPSQIIKAQCYLACNALSGNIELFTTDVNTGTLGVKMEKVSSLQTEYFQGLREDYLLSQGNKKYPYIWNLLKPFSDNSKNSIGGVTSIGY